MHGPLNTRPGPVRLAQLTVSVGLQSFHMQSCRILGVKWHDKITNAAIKETTRQIDLPTFPHRRSTTLTFWPYLPIIQGYTSSCTASIHWRLHRHTSCQCHWLEVPAGPSTENLKEDSDLPISACQFATMDRSLWRLLRPSASQAQQ